MAAPATADLKTADLVVLVSYLMGVVVLGIAMAGERLLPGWAILTTIAIVAAGLVSYGAAGAALGAFRPSDIRGAVRRKKG